MMSKDLSRYIEPVAFVTILVGYSYFIGWFYTQSYFLRLGIQYEFLDLSPTYYLIKAVLIEYIILVIIMIILLIYLTKISRYYNKLLNLKKDNFLVFSLIIILISFMFLNISMIFSGYVGEVHATRMIEGKNPYISINISWNENPMIEIDNKELILILHNEGNYYIVNKQYPAPEFPEIYVISDDQIKYAVIKMNQVSS